MKYKILQARRAPLSEQIEALEDFKKAEYVEKWAYELAKLYHEAGMTTECLEECDDLILWFSEGRYVYQAMELKMKYKPLTPLQQEKYDSMKHASAHMSAAAPAEEADDTDQAEPEEENAADGQEESSVMNAETREIRLDERRSIQEEAQAEEDLPEEAGEEEAADEKADVKPEAGAAGKASSISRMVKGATLGGGPGERRQGGQRYGYRRDRERKPASGTRICGSPGR